MHRVPLLSFHFLLFLFLPQVYSFVHPGLLVTNSDIDRVKRKLSAKKDPWLSSWNALTSIKYSSASYTPRAVSSVDRSKNGALLWRDAAAAFNLALRWKISGDAQYADASARVLVAWGSQLKSFGGADDKYLTAGLQGYELANAAELLRDYPPFARNGFATVTRMLTTLILPANIKFLNHGEPSEHNHRHFFANWELGNVASAMAISVLADDKTSWDFAINYFKNGTGNGAIGNAITNIVKEPGTGNLLGQGQEAGRDQGHSALDFQLLGVIGQQAWNQGEDLFAYDKNRILLGYVTKSHCTQNFLLTLIFTSAEYYARYNLGYDVPFVPYTNYIVSYSVISPASRGAVRPAWELLYNHYAVIKRLQVPWTKKYRNYTLQVFNGFEGGAGSRGGNSGDYDGLGWGSLLYRLEKEDVASIDLKRRNNHVGIKPLGGTRNQWKKL